MFGYVTHAAESNCHLFQRLKLLLLYGETTQTFGAFASRSPRPSLTVSLDLITSTSSIYLGQEVSMYMFVIWLLISSKALTEQQIPCPTVQLNHSVTSKLLRGLYRSIS